MNHALKWSSGISLIALYLFLGWGYLESLSFSPKELLPFWQDTRTIWLSIIFEALPFLMLGVLASSLIQVFISEQTIARYIPKSLLWGTFAGCFMGFIFPVCECGMIPVVRKLIQKGMPVYTGIAFILAGPIVNPIVIASTYVAFPFQIEMVLWRVAGGLIVSALVAVCFAKVSSLSLLKKTPHAVHDHHHSESGASKWWSVAQHGADEFFDMMKYVILGALITAFIQTGIGTSTLVAIGDEFSFQPLFMMGFAYFLSLCSNSDAFIAASFQSSFSSASLLAFLVYGPMLDFKNTFMLLSVFRKRYVFILSTLVTLFVFLFILNIASWRGGV